LRSSIEVANYRFKLGLSLSMKNLLIKLDIYSFVEVFRVVLQNMNVLYPWICETIHLGSPRFLVLLGSLSFLLITAKGEPEMQAQTIQ